MFHELCGDTTLKNMVLVTNMWSTIPRKDGEALEKELPRNIFKLALGKGAHMVRHQDTVHSAHDIIRRITTNCPIASQIQQEPADKRKDFGNTTAEEATSRELDKQTRRHQDELKRVREDVTQALKEKDETKKELEEDRGRLQEWMVNVKKDSERLEARMKEMEQAAKKEREQVAAEHGRQLADLTRRLQGETNVCLVHRARLEQEIQKLQDHVTAMITVSPHPTP